MYTYIYIFNFWIFYMFYSCNFTFLEDLPENHRFISVVHGIYPMPSSTNNK